MPRNIVLLVLDTVRKDYFDQYAPRLQDYSSTSFGKCRAPSSWSTPSHASLMTGVLPHEHGIHAHNIDFSQLQGDTFLDDLPEYTTVGISANVFAGPDFGFDKLFDEFTALSRHDRFANVLDIEAALQGTDHDDPRRYLQALRAALIHERPVRSLLNATVFKIARASEGRPVPRPIDYGTKAICGELRRLLSTQEEPLFVFANLMEAHQPYEHSLPYDRSLHGTGLRWHSNDEDPFEINTADNPGQYEEYFERYRELYGASIDYLDRRLARLCDDLDSLTDRETTVIITADHGQNLGSPADDRLIGHVSSLSEGLLHVPLEIINPPAEFPTRIEDDVSLLDLPELVTSIVREETPDLGREVVPAEQVGYSLGEFGDDRYWDRMLRCACRGDTKYRWDSLGQQVKCRITDRPNHEETIATDVDVPTWATDEFSIGIEDYRREPGETPDIKEKTRDQLSNLGYL